MSANSYAPERIAVEKRAGTISPSRLARIAGLLYLIIIVSGIFAQFFVRQSLVVPGDAAATANNVLASEMLLRTGIAADLIMILADVALALVFYVLFKPVSSSLSLLAAFFRLTQAAVLAANLLNLIFALRLFGGTDILAVIGTEQLQALGMVFLDAHGIGYSIAMAFFGINLLVLGYLIIKSGYFPKLLGILLVLASMGYLFFDSFAKILMPNYAAYQATFDMAVIVPAFIAELAFCLWLLVKGVNVPQEAGRPSMRPTQVESTAS